jgi:hypothetical protein
MDIGKAFAYVFEDPNWVMKLLVGGGILFVGVLFSFLIGIPLLVAGALVLGYSLLVTRNVAEGVAAPLPEWTDFGALFMKGLYAIVGIIIYFLPVIVLGCCVGVLSAVGGSASTSTSSSTGDTVTGIVSIVALCLNCLITLYSIVAGITLYAPMTRFAMSANQLSVFWDIRGNMDFITKNIGNYVIAVLIAFVASFIAGFGLILCGIGIFFTSFWAYLVGSFMFGQLWRNQAGSTMASYAPPPAPTM